MKTLKDMTFLNRIIYKTQAAIIEPFTKKKQIFTIQRDQDIQSDAISQDPSAPALSYKYTWHDFTQQNALMKFMKLQDKEIGGNSHAEFFFDKANQCSHIVGKIIDTDRSKLINYPFIGLGQVNPYVVKTNPFTALSLELKSDGKPIQVEISVYSPHHGILEAYGIIESRNKHWQCYELPFINFMIRGTEDDPKTKTEYMNFNPEKQNIFENDIHDMRKIIETQLLFNKSLVVTQVMLKMVGSLSAERNVSLRRINLVRRAGYLQFRKEYMQPYFFIVQDEDCEVNTKLKLKWMNKSYQDLSVLDFGDKKYFRKKRPVQNRFKNSQ